MPQMATAIFLRRGDAMNRMLDSRFEGNRTKVRRRPRVILALAAVALGAVPALLLPNVAGADETLDPCPAITGSTTLHADCTGPLAISVSDVTVNLTNHEIRCDTGALFGVVVLANRVELKNGRVSDCTYGLIARGDASQFVNLRIERNSIGIDLVGNENRLIRTFVADNEGGAFVSGNFNHVTAATFARNGGALAVGLGSENHVRSSRFIDNLAGYRDEAGFENLIESSTFVGTTFSAILVRESPRALVQGNTITANGPDAAAITLVRSPGTTVARNNVHDNASAGIQLFGESGDEVTQNSLRRNRVGIWLSADSTANRVTKNIARDSESFDLRDDTPSCDANTWLDNRFAVASQPCIH
jgi:parallel beta-helix repeat protein